MPNNPYRHNLRILAAEDNRVNQLLLRAFLTKSGWSLDLADNGQHALELLMKWEYGLVLMDIQMPGIDGIAATRIIRSMASYLRDIPIVAATACLQIGREGYKKLGFDDVVFKPLDCAVLSGTIENTVRMKQGWNRQIQSKALI